VGFSILNKSGDLSEFASSPGLEVPFKLHENNRTSSNTLMLPPISRMTTGWKRKMSDEEKLNICDYELILTDCSMPFMDGYECTKCIRLLLEYSGITTLKDQPRIVAVTGHFEPEFQMKAIQSGMEKVFPKPMT